MSQYPGTAATSDGGYYNTPTAPSSASTAGYAGMGAANGGQPMPSMPEASDYLPGGAASGSGAGYSGAQLAPALGGAALGAGVGAGAGAMAGMSSKQREAYQERQRFQVANQPTSPVDGNGQSSGGYSPVTSPNPEGDRQIVVSHDAGPIEDDEPFRQGGDIPPT